MYQNITKTNTKAIKIGLGTPENERWYRTNSHPGQPPSTSYRHTRPESLTNSDPGMRSRTGVTHLPTCLHHLAFASVIRLLAFAVDHVQLVLGACQSIALSRAACRTFVPGLSSSGGAYRACDAPLMFDTSRVGCHLAT